MAERGVVMDYGRLLRFMTDERKKQIQKVIDTLKMGGRSKKTIDKLCTCYLSFFKILWKWRY